MAMNVLSLHHAVHESELPDGDPVRQSRSHHLDFHVDGRPLRDWFGDTHDVITALNRPWLDTLDEGIAELTGCRGRRRPRHPSAVPGGPSRRPQMRSTRV